MEILARCHPCHREYQRVRLQQWRDGIRGTGNLDEDLTAVVSVLVQWRNRISEPNAVMLGNAAQLVEFVLYLEEQAHEPKQKHHWSSTS
jgi:hypothetical protein